MKIPTIPDLPKHSIYGNHPEWSGCDLCGVNRMECGNRYCSDNPHFVGKNKGINGRRPHDHHEKRGRPRCNGSGPNQNHQINFNTIGC